MKMVIAAADAAIRQTLRDGENFPDDEIVFSDPADLITAVADTDLRVLLVDLIASRPAGIALCRQIRLRNPVQPYVYLIALVRRDADADRLAAFEAGIDAILPQPSHPKELIAKLEVARRIIHREDLLRYRSDELEQIRRDLETRNAALCEIASSDALTGLKNRRFFAEALDAQFSLARRKGLPMSLVMIDVDQFKGYNDRFGHPAGDDVLREVGALLRSCLRDHDIVARYGGEEFAILLAATEESECLSLLDLLRLTVMHHPWPLRAVTISLGVATLRASDTHPYELLDQADRALYYSKALGRNRATHARDLPELGSNPLSARLPMNPLITHGIATP